MFIARMANGVGLGGMYRRQASVGLCLALGLLPGCALLPGTSGPPADIIGSDDLTTHCHRLWATDQDSFRLCQQLQNRSRLQLSRFVHTHDVSRSDIAGADDDDDSPAGAIKQCLKRWRPDYTSVWRCVEAEQES